jgi:hypothetical protein
MLGSARMTTDKTRAPTSSGDGEVGPFIADLRVCGVFGEMRGEPERWWSSTAAAD